jgi:uncharacterized membrane protein (UPF0127 family)
MDGVPRSSESRGREGRRRRGTAWGLLALGVVGVVAGLTGIAYLLGTRARQVPGPATGTAVVPASGRYAYLLEPAGRPAARVSLEVAADEASRQRGLSNRSELPAGTGMAFLFPRDTTVRFWMKDTLVPLQIAFVGGDGRVVGLFEMPPCHQDPCPTYGPTMPYRYAVELPSGSFTAAGIRQGDRVAAEHPAELPTSS